MAIYRRTSQPAGRSLWSNASTSVFALHGYPLAQPYHQDTINIAPGQRVDVLVDCQNPGTWAFHCHILTDAEGPDGMFGMLSALVVS